MSVGFFHAFFCAVYELPIYNKVTRNIFMATSGTFKWIKNTPAFLLVVHAYEVLIHLRYLFIGVHKFLTFDIS